LVTLRILHLSDLHVSVAQDWNQRVIVDGLLKDLEHFQGSRRVDLVVFTGDLGYTGQPDDLARGRAILIDPIMSKLSLGPDHVIMVPGNHDVDRARIEPIYEAGLGAKLNNREAVNDFLLKADLGAALDRLSAWKQFTDSFYESVDRQFLNPLAWTRRLTVDGIKFGIAALNSAWRATGVGDAERGSLILGEPQVHTALEQIQSADVRLIAFHHPLAWLQRFDHDDTRVQLERSGAVVLTGHDHENDPSADFSTRGSALYGRVGCLYQTRFYRNSYAVIDVDAAAATATFSLREWVDQRTAFDFGVTSAEGGNLMLPLPRRPGTAIGPPIPFTRVTQGLLEVINRSAVLSDLISSPAPTSAADVLVPPRFYPVPFAEVVAASIPEKGATISRVDPLAALAAARVVIVNGGPGAGVTDSLLWIIERQFSRDGSYLPIYSRLDARPGKRVIDEDLREGARRVGLLIGPDDVLPRAVVAIDDITHDSDRAVNRLVAHIHGHEDNLYVLGTHGDGHIKIVAALSKIGIEPSVIYLGPFGRKEMKQIAARVAGEDGSKLPDQVLNVLSDKGLPRTPFVMVTLLAVLIEKPEAVVLNATAVVDAYVSVLLGRTEVNLIDPMDSRGREHFLEYLAGELTRAREFWLERQQVEKIAIAYFESRRLHISAGRLIDDLISRKILLDDGGYIGFRHLTFQDLFAAKLMAEDDDFASFIRSQALEYREVIEHAAALSRADGDLLSFVGSIVRPVILEWAQDVANARLDLLSDTTRNTASDVETLQRTLQLTAPPPEELFDKLLDDLWERRADTAADRPETVDRLNRQQVLMASTGLLSDVLVSSELVDDIPLRVSLLKDAIRGWSSVAISLLQQEEDQATVRSLVERVLLKGEAKDELRPALDRLVRIIVLFTAAVGAVASLGKRQTQGLIQEVAADQEFMAGAVHSLLTTLLAVFLKSPGWPEQLIALKTSHGSHPFVADFVHNLALNRYQMPSTSDAEANSLKRFLIDDICERSGSAPSGVQERQRLRSKIDAQLQKTRVQVKLKGRPPDLFAQDHVDLGTGEDVGNNQTTGAPPSA
jgi:predicted phosphodiesterase